MLREEAMEVIGAIVGSVGLTQRELAGRLKVSEARVSRLLNGRENLTLRTIADLGWATGLRFDVVAVPFEDRTGTPAEHDPPPPRWLARHAGRLATRVRRALKAY